MLVGSCIVSLLTLTLGCKRLLTASLDPKLVLGNHIVYPSFTPMMRQTRRCLW